MVVEGRVVTCLRVSDRFLSPLKFSRINESSQVQTPQRPQAQRNQGPTRPEKDLPVNLPPPFSLLHLFPQLTHHSQPRRPNFSLIFIRTPFAPPNHATFITPLNFNKFDIIDYLYHLYGIEVLSVRSYVQQGKVRRGKERDRIPSNT